MINQLILRFFSRDQWLNFAIFFPFADCRILRLFLAADWWNLRVFSAFGENHDFYPVTDRWISHFFPQPNEVFRAFFPQLTENIHDIFSRSIGKFRDFSDDWITIFVTFFRNRLTELHEFFPLPIAEFYDFFPCAVGGLPYFLPQYLLAKLASLFSCARWTNFRILFLRPTIELQYFFYNRLGNLSIFFYTTDWQILRFFLTS